MNRFILLLAFFTSNVFAAKIEYPKLYFAMGLPAIEIQKNSPEVFEDFVAINIGSVLQYDLSEKSAIGVIIDASYTPKRKDLKVENNNQDIIGDTSLLVSFYSVTYSQKIAKFPNHNLWLSAGPTLGLYTLQFDNFKVNDTDITDVNRIRVRNAGYRIALKYMDENRRRYLEIAYYKVVEEKFTVIDDSSLDAESIREDDSIDRRSNQAIIINYGFRLF